jgi:predicted acetyltransferase
MTTTATTTSPDTGKGNGVAIRPTQVDERRAAADTMSGALLTKPTSDEAWEKRQSSWDESVSFAAWRGAECVGHAAYFPFDTVVPGGARVPGGGVTRVGVRQTARRLGVASDLMNTLTDRAAATGLTLLSLRASEATIYRRFGYGVAGHYTAVKIDPRRARPVRGAATGGSFRMLTADEVLKVVPNLYEQFGLQRPGTIARPPSFYTRYFEGAIEKSESSYVVVHTDDAGVDDGYVHYSTKWSEDSGPNQLGKGELFDLVGADDAVELALWQFLLHVDLVTEWVAEERPVDDLIRAAIGDRRAYTVTHLDDEQWLRLIDVDAALRARTYQQATGAVVVEVGDPRLSGNNGRWRITADGAVRDDAATPDLIAPITAISAAYLGGHPWWQLVSTGDATATNPAAVATADALFAVPRAPFCGSFF